jgi:hypothetical protein
MYAEGAPILTLPLFAKQDVKCIQKVTYVLYFTLKMEAVRISETSATSATSTQRDGCRMELTPTINQYAGLKSVLNMMHVQSTRDQGSVSI